MKMFLQFLQLALVAISMLILIHRDINGRKATPPAGFVGVLSTLLTIALGLIIYWLCGTYSTFWPSPLE